MFEHGDTVLAYYGQLLYEASVFTVFPWNERPFYRIKYQGCMKCWNAEAEANTVFEYSDGNFRIANLLLDDLKRKQESMDISTFTATNSVLPTTRKLEAASAIVIESNKRFKDAAGLPDHSHTAEVTGPTRNADLFSTLSPEVIEGLALWLSYQPYIKDWADSIREADIEKFLKIFNIFRPVLHKLPEHCEALSSMYYKHHKEVGRFLRDLERELIENDVIGTFWTSPSSLDIVLNHRDAVEIDLCISLGKSSSSVNFLRVRDSRHERRLSFGLVLPRILT